MQDYTVDVAVAATVAGVAAAAAAAVAGAKCSQCALYYCIFRSPCQTPWNASLSFNNAMFPS